MNRRTPPMHGDKSATEFARADVYHELQRQLAALFVDERNGLANAATMSALLFETLPSLNWAGFYFLQGGELVVGPFQGKVACVRIALGQGVCGMAAQRRETASFQTYTHFPGISHATPHHAPKLSFR